MDEHTPCRAISSLEIAGLVRALESLTDGELAADLLIAAGERSILPLEEFLLQGKARTINWLQEDEAIHLLDKHKALAECEANRVLANRRTSELVVSHLADIRAPWTA